MALPQEDDRQQPLALARELTFGITMGWLIIGLIAISIVAFLLYNNPTNNPKGFIVLLIIFLIVFSVPTILFFCCWSFLRSGFRWGIVFGIVLASLQLCFSSLTILGVVIAVVNLQFNLPLSVVFAISLVLVYVSIQLIFCLSRAFAATREQARGFEPVMDATLNLDYLKPQKVDGGSDGPTSER